MIFKPELAKLILQGKKTQTRRVVKYTERGKTIECRYRAGCVYAVQPGRGSASLGRLTVTEVREECLGDLSLPDARREGFRTRTEFVDYWTVLHGTYDPSLKVWVISFVKGDATDTPRLLRGGAPQAPICHAPVKLPDGRTVTCKRAFQDNQTVCKCGAKRPPETEQDHGYTTRRGNAMRNEGEAVPVALQEKWAAKAAIEGAAKRAELRQRALAAIATVNEHAEKIPASALDPAARKKLKSALHRLRDVERETSTGVPSASSV